MKNLIIIFILLSLTSCMDFNFDQTTEYHIDPQLEKFVNSFYKEAKKRGIQLDKNNLIVELNPVCEDCNGKSTTVGDQRRVIIKQWTFNGYMYDSNDTTSKAIELLVFHELGHALLYRKHNHIPMSIMHAETDLRMYQHSDSLRTILIDELFSELTH